VSSKVCVPAPITHCACDDACSCATPHCEQLDSSPLRRRSMW
jgi:hypothetical protein